jgi:arginyl-tRNA synthetase
MFLEELKLKIKASLEIIRPFSGELVFSYPPNSELGDLSLACFELAKTQQKNPAELARELAEKLTVDQGLKKYFTDIKAVGPYLNFFIAVAHLAVGTIGDIKTAGARYGDNKKGGAKKVMIEYSNGNTHKEHHIGHLRNISYGDAIYRLLAANGYRAIPVSYINDFGIHVAKTIWNWQRRSSYAERPEPKGYLLGKCYAEASRELAEHPEYKEEVGRIMTEIESRYGANYKLWRQSRQWSIDYFFSIYQELNVSFRKIFYESELLDAGLKLVAELTTQGILRKSEGALIADLEKYGLGILPIIRSDGTALYPVADLALASEKFKKYGLDESIYIVDVRQSLYFKQLFKILDLMGYRKSLRHLTYDFVTLPEGMMASRTGNVITYRELKAKLLEKLMTEITQRHPDWSVDRVTDVALNLAISTMKFEMLKVGAEKIITFNVEEALKFDGYTACYLQYGYVRLQSIVRKAGFNLFVGRPDLSKLTDGKEKALLMKIARYPEIIAQAGAGYNPSELTKYLFELVQLFSDYYHEVNILKAATAVRRARLTLVKAIAQVLKNGFGILGIKESAGM